MTIGRPAWIPEADVQAHWMHWYNLFKSGDTFTFQKTTPPPRRREMVQERVKVRGKLSLRKEMCLQRKRMRTDPRRVVRVRILSP